MIDLVREYIEAKKAEKAATERRIALGNKIADGCCHNKEGQKTFSFGEYKVRIKCVINRKVDWDLMDKIKFIDPPWKTKRELDMKVFHRCEINQPQTFHEMLKAITSTPGTTQVEIVGLEDE